MEITFVKTETSQHLCNFRLNVVALAMLEQMLDLAEFVHHPVKLFILGRDLCGNPGNLSAEYVHPVMHGDNVIEGRRRFIKKGASAVGNAILRQIADGVIPRLCDLAAVGIYVPRDDFHQGGFARSVRTDDSNPLVVANAQRDILEQDLAGIFLGNRVEGYQGIKCFLNHAWNS